MKEPASAEVLGHVADMSREDFVRAIKIADKGFRKYSTSTTFAERGAQLRKWFDLVHENVDDCISLHLTKHLISQWLRF
jgi:succinate-semialdehyde dehydrogenase/glutarate-semialdehyde dehydrogenase